jgi:hypothetical protein
VLARLPDAPAGTKGISLFVVPKFIPMPTAASARATRSPAARSRIKMGIHGSSTCQMNLDGATGWIIGQPNKGLNAMFVMMNAARLGVGMQGLGLTEVAYQNALVYARERLQMRSLSGPKAPEQAADPIIVHPDVRRMLLTARAYAEGGRAFSSFIAMMIDRELSHPDESVRKDAADLVTLLTPIVKAFMTDNGWIATSEAMQVHGGSGFITGTGVEQYVRDARINMIYEGTNTIQSLDLLGRKILMDNGAKLKKFGALVQAFVEENGTDEAMNEFVTPLADLGDKVTKLTMEIGMKAMQNQDEVGAAAVPYLRVVGHLVYSYFFARMAKIALEKQDSGDTFLQGQARHRALLLCPPAAGNRHADSPGACRRQVSPRSRSRTVLTRKIMSNFIVRKVAVLGAGVMGAQIAAHCVNAKVPVVLFDLPAKEGPKNGIVLKAIEGLKKLSPAPLGNKDDAACIEVANYDDNLELLKGCDLIIEAIAERMDWKHDLYKKVAPFIAPNAIFASNTSGLSITALSDGFDAGTQSTLLRRAFLQPAALHASGRTDPDRGDAAGNPRPARRLPGHHAGQGRGAGQGHAQLHRQPRRRFQHDGDHARGRRSSA